MGRLRIGHRSSPTIRVYNGREALKFADRSGVPPQNYFHAGVPPQNYFHDCAVLPFAAARARNAMVSIHITTVELSPAEHQT
jgi:hypothetical protein